MEEADRIFLLLEPVYQAIRQVLQDYGVPVLTLLTGRGYHFAFQIPKSSRSYRSLVELGREVSATQFELLRRFTAKWRWDFGREEACAFEGLGRLVEYLGHVILSRYSGAEELPLVFTDTAVGWIASSGRRHAVSLDLSLYGDPLPRRATRCPFSLYQKHWFPTGCTWGDASARQQAAVVVLPRDPDQELCFLLQARTSLSMAVEVAQGARCQIPVVPEESFLRLLAAYSSSKLSQIHRELDGGLPAPLPSLPSGLPPCARFCLEKPYPHLLKPTNLQTITRCLLSAGWTPAQIATLVVSRYRLDLDWGDLWIKYDLLTRAKFYVRIFSSLVLTGLDRSVDLNCVSHKEKGYCCQRDCGFNLEHWKPRLQVG